MRAVVAVLLFVTAAHAGLWGLFQEKQPAPDFRGILPSVSYAPFEGSAHPDVDNIPQIEKIRADLKKLSTITRAIRLYSSTGGVELVPPIAAEFGLKVTRRRLDRQECRSQQARDRGGDQPCQAQQQRQRRRRRQRNHFPRRAEDRRPDRADQAGEEVRQRSRDDGRNLEHLARQSGTGVLRRFHRRARAALLGKLHRQAGRRSGGGDVPAAARPVSGKTDRDRRIRLAERRL